jgi:hypothetical protein
MIPINCLVQSSISWQKQGFFGKHMLNLQFLVLQMKILSGEIRNFKGETWVSGNRAPRSIQWSAERQELLLLGSQL